MFSRSSSPESLSSFDTQSVHSSVISEYSRRASQVVSPSEIPDSPSESMPSSPPRRAHSPTRRFREHLNNFSSTPKSTNVLAKQSLDMNRTPATLRSEPFMNFAAFDESNKPLDFTNRKLSGLSVPPSAGKIPPNPGLMLHNFPAFDDDDEDDQPINFSSRDQESQQQPPLTFSTFQKNIPPPAAHQLGGAGAYGGGSNNTTPSRLLTPRGKSSLPTLVEQSVAENAETESSSGKSEIPVVYAEEGTPPNMSETTSLSGLTMDHLDIGQGESNPTGVIIKGLAGLSLGSVPNPGYAPDLGLQQQEQPHGSTPGFSQMYPGVTSLPQTEQTQQQQQQQQQQNLQSGYQKPQQVPSAPSKVPLQPVAMEPNLPKLEEKECGAEAAPPSKSSGPSLPPAPEKGDVEEPVEDSSASASAVPAARASGDEVSPPPPKALATAEEEKQDERDSSMSEVSEGEEDILAQCISSGMPTPSASSARKMRRSSSDNAIKKRSGIPTKTESTPAAASSKAGASASKQTSSSSKHTSSSPKPGNSASQLPKLPKPSALPSASPSKSSKGKSERPSSHSRNTGQPEHPSSHTPPPTSGKPQQAAQSQPAKPHSRATAGASGKSSASKNLNPALNRAAAAKTSENCQKRPPQSPAKSSGAAKPMGAATVIAHNNPAAAAHGDPYADFSRDCVKSYATEGTPINFSAATSLSDLSILTHSSSSPSNKKSSSSSKSPGETDSKSDNSSLCEENEELLLSQMIEHGMPKGRSSGRRYGGGGDNSGGGSGGNDGGGGKKQNSKDCNTSAFVPRMSNLRVVAPFHDFVPAADTVKTYNVEGTPRNFSAATSLSDLTIDSIEGPGKAGKGAGASGGSKPSKAQQPPASYVPGPFSPPPSDSLHNYNLEGSPLTFSHNASSLSSLGDELEARGAGSGVSASPHKDNSGSQQMYTHQTGAAVRNTCPDQNESDSSSSIPPERHIVGQSSEDSSIAGDSGHIGGNNLRGGEQPIRYTVEDTPVTFSRNSSLSSLNSLDKGESPLAPAPEKRDAAGSAGAIRQDAVLKQQDAGSDSDDLADCDPTPSEQALLDQCIISAMPKSRLPRGDERARRHSRAKFMTQRVTRNSGGLSSSDGSNMPTVAGSTVMGGSSPDGLDKSGAASSSFMENTLTNGYHSSGEVDGGSQLSLDGDVNTMMTRSCSDTTELCLDFDTPMETYAPTRQSRYGSWKHQRQRHRSSDGAEVRGHNSQQHHQQRSQSQEGSLKMHKDISNKLARDNHGQPTRRQGRMEPQPQAEVSDFAAKVREISKDNMAGLVALKDDVDIDKAVFSGHGTLEVAAERQDDDEDVSDSGDITLRSGRTDAAQGEDGDSDEDIHDGDVDGDDNYMYEYVEESEAGEERGNVNIESFNSELLEENVRLIVSEIQTNGKTITSFRSLGSSTVDEDLFLENETISLVSNDAFSDTNSELSVDVGGSTQDAATVPAKTGGPKILKPGEASSKVAPAGRKGGDDSPPDGKGIRGRRKPLYPGKSTSQAYTKGSANSKAAAMVKPSMARGVSTNSSSPRLVPPSASSANSTGLKKTSPRSQPNQKVAHVSPTPRVTTQSGKNPSAAVGRTPVAHSNSVGGTGLKGRPGAASALTNKSTGSSGSPPQMKNATRIRSGVSPHSATPANRSPPTQPNKGGKMASKTTALSKTAGQTSNTKTRPSQQGRENLPSTNSQKKGAEVTSANTQKLSSPDNKENKAGQNQGAVVVTMREKKNQSALSSSNRHSNCSQEGGSDNSTGSNTSERPNSWGKALDQYNFYVDETQDGQAYKQIQNQRNSRDAPGSIKRSLKAPSVSSNSPAQPPANSSQGQSRLPTAATKTSRSLSRTGIASRSPSTGRGVSTGRAVTKPTQQAPQGRGRGAVPTKAAGHKSNDSLKSQGRPLTPVGRRSSSNSSGSGIPTPRKVGDGSSPPSPAANGKRPQAHSKIASFRRRDGSLDNSPSSGSSTSSSASPPQSSRLPTKQGHQTARSLPPSGTARPSTKKASTLPAGSSLEQAVAAAGISKSSTFEKISTPDKQASAVQHSFPVQEKKGASLSTTAALPRTSGSFESPESGVRRGEVFELCDDNAEEGDYDDVYEGTDDDPDASNEAIPVFEDSEPAEDSVGLDLDTGDQSLLVESPARIDSGTYRRKKPASDFELPNADETCRSMCSFNESLISAAPMAQQPIPRAVSSGSSSNSINEHNSTTSSSTAKAEEKAKGKSKVAQGLKRLFGSGRGKSKDSEKPANSKTGKKSSKWDRKHSKDLDFFSRNIKMEPSTLVDAEDDHLFHTSGIHLRTGGSCNDHKSSPSAIVTPFNYSPPSVGHYTSTSSNGVVVVDLNNSVGPVDNTSTGSSKTGSNPHPAEDGSDRPLTKTEILVARRNNSNSNKSSVTAGEDVNGAACMITTV